MDREYLNGLGLAPELIDGILAEHNKALGASKIEKPKEQPIQSKVYEGVSQEDYDRLAEELEQIKSKGMTAEELAQAEIAKAQKTEAKYRLELAKMKVAQVFSEAGLTEEEYAPLVDSVSTADEKVSLALARQFSETLKAKTEAAEKSVREQIMKDTPETKGGEPSGEGEEISLGAQMAEAYSAKFN